MENDPFRDHTPSKTMPLSRPQRGGPGVILNLNIYIIYINNSSTIKLLLRLQLELLQLRVRATLGYCEKKNAPR